MGLRVRAAQTETRKDGFGLLQSSSSSSASLVAVMQQLQVVDAAGSKHVLGAGKAMELPLQSIEVTPAH